MKGQLKTVLEWLNNGTPCHVLEKSFLTLRADLINLPVTFQATGRALIVRNLYMDAAEMVVPHSMQHFVPNHGNADTNTLLNRFHELHPTATWYLKLDNRDAIDIETSIKLAEYRDIGRLLYLRRESSGHEATGEHVGHEDTPIQSSRYFTTSEVLPGQSTSIAGPANVTAGIPAVGPENYPDLETYFGRNSLDMLLIRPQFAGPDFLLGLTQIAS